MKRLLVLLLILFLSSCNKQIPTEPEKEEVVEQEQKKEEQDQEERQEQEKEKTIIYGKVYYLGRDEEGQRKKYYPAGVKITFRYIERVYYEKSDPRKYRDYDRGFAGETVSKVGGIFKIEVKKFGYYQIIRKYIREEGGRRYKYEEVDTRKGGREKIEYLLYLGRGEEIR